MPNEQQQLKPDRSEPSLERQAELETYYEMGLKKFGDAPYKGVQIRTLGELEWIMRQRNWSSGRSLPVGKQANLSGADLHGVNLSGVNLNEANLTGTDLYEADLTDAVLSLANLSGAYLGSACLSGADLVRTLMNAETILDHITMDAKTKVLGLRWNGVPLDRIDWARVPRLGDELMPKVLREKSPRERTEVSRDAARAYHGLVVALRDQGLNEAASQYRLRELSMQRRALGSEHHLGGWILNVLLGTLAGYGEEPGRVFGVYVGIVTFFTAIFWALTNVFHGGSQPLQWYEAAVLSLTAFHGRGFFPNTINLGDPLAVAAALEAVFGLFIELLFIATFTRRFLD